MKGRRMYRNAFLSEFSFSGDDQLERVLKCHLLSNEQIVIPAGSALSTGVGAVLAGELDTLGEGAVVLAHGSDCANLAAYVDKYPAAAWSGSLLDVFRHFDGHDLRVVYQTSTTTTRFNKLMRDSAEGRNPSLSCMFSRVDFCRAVLDSSSEFDLPQYLTLVDRYVSRPRDNEALKAHARYAYNYFGAFSTSAGNTFSLENTNGFDHVCAGYDSADARSGIELLISAALDLTDGISDLAFLSDLDTTFLDRLTYSDILEIRDSWLHHEVLRKYDDLVQACAASYFDLKQGDTESAVRFVEMAFEIRESVLETVRLAVQSEVTAYKIHRIVRFLADASLKFVSYLSGFEFARTVAGTLKSAVTEVAVVANRETELKRVVAARTDKLKRAAYEAGFIMSPGSPALAYLRTIASRLDEA